MKYFYLGKDTSYARVNYPIPSAPFEAVRAKNNRGEAVFVPIIKEQWDKENEFFAHRIGRIKLKNRKTYEIPLYDGDPAKWNEYKEKWGARCLYYSINGKDYSGDCCNFKEMYEFYSLCHSNVENYPTFVDLFTRMNEIQERVISDKLDNHMLYKDTREGLFFRPSHTIMGFPFPFYADSVADDKRLELFWREYRRKGIPYPERYSKELMDEIAREIDADNDVFPTSMSDRIKMIYGEECEQLYNSALRIAS